MSYNIEMQFAGLCLDGAILLSFLNSKKSESLQFRLFPFQLMVAILLIAFDMGSCVTIPHMEAIPVINAFLGKIPESLILILGFLKSLQLGQFLRHLFF